MSSIARPLQAKLAERFVIGRPDTVIAQTSEDDTRKFLFRFRDGQEAETVYIPDPEEDRGAVCLSSQVGCTLSCRFCHTGTQTLVRNLGAAEIVGQFMAARDAYGEWPSPKGRDAATAVHHRADGHGRAALQLRQRRQGDDHRDGRRGHRPVAPAHHAVHLGRGADDGSRRRGTGREPGGVAARGARRVARRTGAAEPQIPDRRADRRLPPLSRARPTRGASPSNT